MAILFIATWIILLILAVRLISTGWSAASDLSAGNFVESSKTITRPPHPELAEVQPGDELLVVNFTPDEEFINRVKESDNFLHQSLQERIEELIEDDDDDDGGSPVPALR
tara:strand:+ start:595 stop:924 length:330 start_codon:yes stop_codon:yes gene_type:complete